MENFESTPRQITPETSSAQVMAELKLMLETAISERESYTNNKGPIDEAMGKFTLAA